MPWKYSGSVARSARIASANELVARHVSATVTHFRRADSAEMGGIPSIRAKATRSPAGPATATATATFRDRASASAAATIDCASSSDTAPRGPTGFPGDSMDSSSGGFAACVAMDRLVMLALVLVGPEAVRARPQALGQEEPEQGERQRREEWRVGLVQAGSDRQHDRFLGESRPNLVVGVSDEDDRCTDVRHLVDEL